MRCPTLKDLPLPLAGKTGWPWTLESLPLPEFIRGNKPWPKISIVTVNYNYAHFIEETIRSVLLQGYPNLEYIIIDDGSTDGSVEIIKKYEKWLTYWARQDNKGQPNAINAGMRRVSGEIFNWINSDDLLMPDCLSKVAGAWDKLPGAIIGGRCLLFDENSKKEIIVNSNLSEENFIFHWTGKIHYVQPATWVPAVVIKEKGLLDESFYFSFDYEWMVRLVSSYPVSYTADMLAAYRLHPVSKTVTYKDFDKEKELRIIGERYIRVPAWRSKYREFSRHYAAVDWCNEIVSIRQHGYGRLKSAVLIVAKSLSSYRRFFCRFTWGAIRGVLFTHRRN